MRILRYLPVLLGLVGPAACSPSPSGPAAPTAAAAPAPAFAADAALAEVNALRARLGLAPLAADARLADAARAHAAYLARHGAEQAQAGLSAHLEIPGRPGFVAETAADRLEQVDPDAVLASEVIGRAEPVSAAVAAWLAAPETRLALLRPEAHAAGVGATEVGAPLVVTLTADPRALAASRLTNAEVVAFPTVAAGDAPARTVGADGVPRGPVITLSVFGGVISVERVAVTRARDGAVVAATWRTFASDQGVDPRDVIIVPDAPLRAGERYDVRVEGALGGAPLVHAWRFDTAPAELRVAGGPRG